MLLRAVFGKHSVSVVFFSPTRGDFVVFADVMVFDCSYILKCHRYQELRTLRLLVLVISPTRHFTYWTVRLLYISIYTFRLQIALHFTNETTRVK